MLSWLRHFFAHTPVQSPHGNGAEPPAYRTGDAHLRYRSKRGEHEYIIIGLGRFGTSLAEALIAQGHTVLAVDSDYHRVQAVSGTIPHVMHIDATNIDALREIGADNFDTGLVCIGTDFESNLLATVLLRKLGVPRVITKARTRTQRDILIQVGADEVILPEYEAGVRLARRLGSVNFVDYLELDPNVGIIELIAPDHLEGVPLAQTDLRRKHGLTVLAIWRGDALEINPGAESCVHAGDKLLVFGRVADARQWSE